MTITIRPERAADYPEISALVRDSFRYGSKLSDGDLEVRLIEEIRRTRYYLPELSFVAQRDGALVGHFMLSRFPLEDRHEQELLLLCPVAVDYRLLRRGIGRQMLSLGLKEARRLGYKGVLVEGNPQFYRLFGFVTSKELGILADDKLGLPSPDYLMALELVPGSLAEISGKVNFDLYETLR